MINISELYNGTSQEVCGNKLSQAIKKQSRLIRSILSSSCPHWETCFCKENAAAEVTAEAWIVLTGDEGKTLTTIRELVVISTTKMSQRYNQPDEIDVNTMGSLDSLPWRGSGIEESDEFDFAEYYTALQAEIISALYRVDPDCEAEKLVGTAIDHLMGLMYPLSQEACTPTPENVINVAAQKALSCQQLESINIDAMVHGLKKIQSAWDRIIA